MSILINGMDMPKNGRVTIDLASEETGTNIIARITDDKFRSYNPLMEEESTDDEKVDRIC